MEGTAPRDIFERYLRALNDGDMATARQLAHPAFEGFYPQSGELIRGFDNLQAIITNYPGQPEVLGGHRIIGGEERYIQSPLFTMIRVEGSAELLTALQQARYPDGSLWFMIVLGELRDGLVYRTESLFAPSFDPPEWRAAWVELMGRPSGPAEDQPR